MLRWSGVSRVFAIIFGAMGLFGLAGCHPLSSLRGSCHDEKPYMKAQSSPPLQIPDGLEMPDTTNSLHIPRLNEPAPPPRSGKDPCLDQPPDYRTPKPAPAPQA
jgi:uncharacterized lipoprotein